MGKHAKCKKCGKSRKYVDDKNDVWYYRSYSGKWNNVKHYLWGSANTQLNRIACSDYKDGINTLAVRGTTNPNPRHISNVICKSTESKPNSKYLTDMFWGWGQFLDHEIDLTTGSGEIENIIVPNDDPDCPNGTIPFDRSNYDPETGINNIPREQITSISAYIDGTNVYGSDSSRAYALRLLDGSGKLKTEIFNTHELLPLNTYGLDNALAPDGLNPETYFLAGDIRANENSLLTSLHTLFVLEHNRQAEYILSKNPKWEGNEERLFSEARKKIIAIMQAITYNDFIPCLLGKHALCDKHEKYDKYNNKLDASILNEFSTCAYRLGHSMISEKLLVKNGNINLEVNLTDLFFNPQWLKDNGIEGILSGAYCQIMQEVDNCIVDALRTNLFGPPNKTTMMLLDLAALNIQRGRDHGLVDYNTMRVKYHLKKVKTWKDITSNIDLQDKLKSVYDDVNSIDPWIGGICEDHVYDSQVGPLFHAILSKQFILLRDGDRYYYERDQTMSQCEKNEIYHTTLSDVIKRNTSLENVPINVFQNKTV